MYKERERARATERENALSIYLSIYLSICNLNALSIYM